MNKPQMKYTNILHDTHTALNARNLLSLTESAELYKLAQRFNRKAGVLSDKDENKAWNYIERLKSAHQTK
jgi:hypothetical protein